MDPALARRCIAAAARSPRSNPRIAYPRWYLQRWHFLPEGYLSRRSAAGYEKVVRTVYNAAREASILGRLAEVMSKRPPENILELGCGPGRALQALAAAFHNARLTGVDLSPFMLERAERRQSTKRVNLVHADGSALPWASPSFDAVVAVHYFGHLPVAARAPAVTEARRAIAPGGRLYVIDHKWHSALGAAFERLTEEKLLMGGLTLSVYRPNVASVSLGN